MLDTLHSAKILTLNNNWRVDVINWRICPRIDAEAKVTGKALFPGDYTMPDQLYMKILFSERAHAIIRAVNTDQAEMLPGVIAVFTARDVPVNEYGLIIPDQPVLCGPGSEKAFADRVRWSGDQIALVIAESEEIAAEACGKIEVEYEDLPVLTDPVQAMQPDAERIHPDRESNILAHFRVRKGDIDQGFESADVIVEGVYQTPVQEHAYLQPEAGLGYIDEVGRVTVIVGGQWTHEDQEQIAHALDLPLDQVRVIYPSIGGAFGGREDMSVQIVLALAAYRLHQRGIDRPVKIVWSREESIIGHHKRHPYQIRAKWGARKDGTLVAAQVELIEDSGGYAYTSTKVMGNATLLCTGPYEIPNVKVDAYAVYTNNVVGGAFRGFGGPQGAYAAETQMNRLAEILGIDRVEIRLRNVLRDGSLLSMGSPLPEVVSMPQVIEDCAQRAGWHISADEPSHAKAAKFEPSSLVKEKSPAYISRGTGFAAGFKNVGFSFGAPEKCWAKVELRGSTEIEEVVVWHAAAEVGQGTHTVISQSAAEAAGVPFERVKLIASDTAVTGNSGSVSASRMTHMAGNAVKGAVVQALIKWQSEERPAAAEYTYHPPRTTPMDPQTGASNPNFAYGYVAQAITVEVDTETGIIKLLEVVTSDDVGKALNPQQVVGQVEGAVVQALGYALLENFVQQDGCVLTKHLSTYLIPTVLDIPKKIESKNPGIPRSNWTMGGAWRWGNALPACCTCHCRCHP